MNITELTDEQLQKELEQRNIIKQKQLARLWQTGFVRSFSSADNDIYHKKTGNEYMYVANNGMYTSKEFKLESYYQYEPCTEADYLAALEKTVSLFK